MRQNYLVGLVFDSKLSNGEIVSKVQCVEEKYQDALSPELIADSLVCLGSDSIKHAKQQYLELIPYHRELLQAHRIRIKVGKKTLFL